LRLRLKDLQVVLSCTLDGISSSQGSPVVSGSKLVSEGNILQDSLSFFLADSPLTCDLNTRGELESLKVLLALGRSLILLHGDLFEGVALLIWNKSKLQGSRGSFTLGTVQVDLEFNCGCGRIVHL